jgi:hypothetical protein
MTDILLNRLDLSTLGFRAEIPLSGWADSAPARDATVQIPGAAGVLPAGAKTLVDPRQVLIAGNMTAATQALLQTNLQQLRGLASAGLVELIFGDDPTKFAMARSQGVQVSPEQGAPPFIIPQRHVEMRFICYDPYLYDLSDRVVAQQQAGTFVAVPLGTAPVRPLIRVHAPGASLTLTLASWAGITLTTMVFAFSPSLGANDYVDINCDTFQITKSVSGVVADAYASFTSGTFLTLDPEQGGILASLTQGPLLKASAGVMEVFYVRAWR